MAQPLAEASASIGQHAEKAASQMSEALSDGIGKEKEVAAQRVGEIAQAVHGTADQLRDKLPLASDLIDDAAQALERASTALGESSVQEIVGSLNKFARDQPALFFGGAILAGISLTRFLKSTGESGPAPGKA